MFTLVVTGSAGAETCAGWLMNRVVDDAELADVIVRVDQPRVATLLDTVRDGLRIQVRLDERLDLHRRRRDGEVRRLSAVEHVAYRVSSAPTVPLPAGGMVARWMTTPDVRRLIRRDRLIAGLARAHAAAVAEGVDAHRELATRLTTAVMSHGYSVGDDFYVLVADAPDAVAGIVSGLGRVRDHIDDLVTFFQKLKLAAASPHVRFGPDFEEARRRAVDALGHVSGTVAAMMDAGTLAPVVYRRDATIFNRITRGLLVRTRAEWQEITTPGKMDLAQATNMLTRVEEMRRQLTDFEAHFRAVHVALITRRTELLSRLEDLVHAESDAEVGFRPIR